MGQSHGLGNDSVPKIVTNRHNKFSFLLNCNQHFGNFEPRNSFRECCLIKLLLYFLFEKYICILSLEVASPRNHQHCANIVSAHFRWTAASDVTAVLSARGGAKASTEVLPEFVFKGRAGPRPKANNAMQHGVTNV